MYASEEMGREMERRANLGKDFAESIAPVDTGRYRYGRFLLTNRTDPGGHRRRRARGNFEELPENDQGGFHVERFVTDDGMAAARLYNPTLYAKYIEWGSVTIHAHHVLAQALDVMKAG